MCSLSWKVLLILSQSFPVKPVLPCGTPGAVLELWELVFLHGVCWIWGPRQCLLSSLTIAVLTISVPIPNSEPSLILALRLGCLCPSAFTCCRCRGDFKGLLGVSLALDPQPWLVGVWVGTSSPLQPGRTRQRQIRGADGRNGVKTLCFPGSLFPAAGLQSVC